MWCFLSKEHYIMTIGYHPCDGLVFAIHVHAKNVALVSAQRSMWDTVYSKIRMGGSCENIYFKSYAEKHSLFSAVRSTIR
jgi:hypothetical protein